MNIFVVNCGSSSLKYDFIDIEKSKTIVSGQFTNIGNKGSEHEYEIADLKNKESIVIPDHEIAFQILNTFLLEHVFSVNKNSTFDAIGHRVVHGGEKFVDAVVIDEQVKATIEELIPLAPLHNPVNLLGINLCEKFFPDVKQVAVFDTAFHQTMAKKTYLYGVPFDWYQKNRIRKYGFHGNSHYYVALKAAEYLQQPYNKLKIISCHLGNGASICAIQYGESIDTSMGFSPLEGLMMGTRSGDIDPTIIQFMVNQEKMPLDAVMAALNKKSGLLGISDKTNDMRNLIDNASHGDEQSALAIKMFVNKIIKTIGSYIALLGDVDAIIFTGGIGENSYQIRERVCQKLEFCGAIIDEDVNISGKKDKNGILDISARISRVKLLAIDTDEEWMIANKTYDVIKGKKQKSPERIPIPIGISARHIHLCQKDVDVLFGKDYSLTPILDLAQPGQFVCEETVTVKGPKGELERVRVLGPIRKNTQLEISRTDEYAIGITTEIRASGDLDDTPGVTIIGPANSLTLKDGVIRALRHIHMNPADALQLQVENGDLVQVKVDGPREMVFGDVLVRVSKKYRLEMHVDTDEANGAELTRGSIGFIIGKQGSRDIYE